MGPVDAPEAESAETLLACSVAMIVSASWHYGTVNARESRIERIEKGVGRVFDGHIANISYTVARPVKSTPLRILVIEIKKMSAIL